MYSIIVSYIILCLALSSISDTLIPTIDRLFKLSDKEPKESELKYNVEPYTVIIIIMINSSIQ